MRRLAVVALVIAGLVLPASAQRGASHGGLSGHSAGAYHGSFSGPRYGFSAPRFSSSFAVPSRAFTVPSRAFAVPSHSFERFPARSFTSSHFMARRSDAARGSGLRGNSRFRSSYSGAEHRRFRHRSRSFYAFGAPAFYSQWVGLEPYGYLLDEPESYASAYNATWADEGSEGRSGAADDNSEAYAPQPPEPEQPVYRENYYQPSAAGMARAPRPLVSEAATTIIFKDGRAPERIHDYAMTRTTLYVLGENCGDIPLDEIDVAATELANRAVGIEFHIPSQVVPSQAPRITP